MTDTSSKPIATTAPLPANEPERLEALRRYNILDTPPEVAFDRITSLAARLFNMPITLVSLVDESRGWFKSAYGFEMREVRRDTTICSFALLSNEVLVIPDTRQDNRLACNPFVLSDPGLRFYAGAPLLTQDGFNLGTLCLLDTKPRDALSNDQKAVLTDLAAMVMDELELRLAARKVAQIDAALLEVTQGVSAAMGEAFFSALVQHLPKVLGVDYVYIGLVEGNNQETIRTVAVCAKGQIIDNFEYLLSDTPCREVLQKRKLCCYPHRVQAKFPKAPLLEPLGVESYIAVPFYDSTGVPLGLLGVMDGNALTNVQLAESLLTIFALRIATELERQQTEAARQQVQHELERLVEQRTAELSQLMQQQVQEQTARLKAEEANRLKDEFLAVLSHELRTPLNPILGWSKLLRSGKLDAAKTDYALETIERNAKLQTQLIEDLLDVSRILQGKLSLNVAPINLEPTIEAAIETVQLAAQAKSIQIETVFDLNVGQVLGNSGRLQQVIWNLLTNAVKFTPSGGGVKIELRYIDSQAEIKVSDTGKGIHPDFLPHVFERFRQADATITRKFGGLGLGLAIVRHLVELHGGTIDAESPGEDLGATFTVRLPLATVAEKTGQDNVPPVDAFDFSQLQILIVDDEADMRNLLLTILENYGAKVSVAASAAEALIMLSRFQPDFLISDIGMPDMDGYMLMRQIRKLAPSQGGLIPAIALTAYAAQYDQQQALEAGFQRHVSKPVEPEELVKAIATQRATA
ncbi:multi-sensor hybrid multi-kinase [Calothrix sp. NIES-4071]|nr:multi-sensor hybrid multi-kinase [Calothrix sp. NIES-4071]BAZ56689.1 multi-sensor hybrid multi-kinase [Calothrix sp. NIES-4105]